VAAVPLAAALRRQDLVHYLYLAAPIASGCRIIVTIHDLVPLALPGYHRGQQSALYTRLMAVTARRADAIITVSEHSRRDIVRLLRIPEQRVHVTYEAVDGRFTPHWSSGEARALRRKYRLPDRFLLYLGGAERRKNLATLVRAWDEVAGDMRGQDVKLVIVADFPPPDALYPDIPGLAAQLGLAPDLHFIRRVDEDDKPALYRAALGFCFPSRYEGFGLPPLEAMACGVPVLAADATSVPEVIGDAGLLLPPDDVTAWADAMRQLVSSAADRHALRERGLRRAARFSWRQTADETIEIYRRVLVT
jgi:glycosyltransferase involved in cell wall biosynthesis